MSQHDMNIANQGFPAFRADLNDALGALVSNSSGATAPATTFAHQYWVDTSANPSILKVRNADNDAFITIGTINQTDDKFKLTPADGVSTDTISELTAAAGVTIDGVLLKDSQVTTDQINEKTAAAGVTIDGVLLKDSIVTATLSGSTVDGTDAVGFRNTPVDSQSAAYTLVLSDSGKTIFHPASDNNARTFTIPANSSVAYPVGTVLTFVNLAEADVTIAITTDTMYLAGDGDTGSRTLAEYGIASAVKLASTDWLISGNGLT